MPELPEVHTTITSLNKAGLKGLQIRDCRVERENTVGGDIPAFCAHVVGKYLGPIQRRGKYILIPLDLGWIQIHLRMSGRLFVSEHNTEEYIRAALSLSDGRWLCLYAPRRFARMLYSPDLVELDSRLGVEPFSGEFSPELLGQLLAGSRRPIKVLLLDQSRVAGIGNIYADEALFEAGIHPAQKAGSLNHNEIFRLHAAIIEALQRGIQNLGTSLGHGKANFTLPDGQSGGNQEDIRVFRRNGLPCVRCGTTIERMILTQRSSHYCPNCQKYVP